METEALIELITRGGVIGVLAFFLIAFLRGWIVSKGIYEEAKEDRDHYRRLAERGTNLAEEASDLSERELTSILRDLLRREGQADK